MKRLFAILTAGIVLFGMAACTPEDKLILDPSKSTAPVISSFVVNDGDIEASYTPGTLNVYKKIVYHFLAITSLDGNEVSKRINSSDKDGVLTAKANNVTRALKELGCEDGSTHAIELVVRASGLQQPEDDATNTFVDSKEKIVIPSYTLKVSGGSGPSLPNIDLSKYEYLAAMEGADTWGIIGPAQEGGWDTDLDLQKISSDPEVWYGSSVTLNADKFKFRGNDTWGDYDLGGGEFAIEAPIVMTKGGGDMSAEAGTYDVYLFPTYGVAYINAPAGGNDLPDIDLNQYEYLSVMEGADTWGLIGPAQEGGWDSDTDLEKISDDPEIWAIKGMALQADKFKFRGNDAWGDYDLGGGEFAVEAPIVMTKGGGDMTAEAGNYDVYLYPTYGVAYIKAAGGSTPPPPEKPKVWSLIGTLEDSGWATDYDLENTSGNTWVIKNVFVREKDEFKIRADHAWNKSVGGPEENAQSTYEEGKAYGVYQPVVGETFTAGGVNIRIGVEGYYNVTFTYGNDSSTILIEEYKEFPDHLYMIGEEFGGWDWTSDGVVDMTPVVYQPTWGAESDQSEAQFFAIRYISAGKGFKFCAKKEWNGDFWGLDTNEGFTESGGNCTVDADGIYLIHIDLKRSIVHVEPARVYGIGNCFGGWDAAMEGALFKADGKTLKATAAADGELRMYVESSISNSGWWTREFIILDGKIDYRGDDEGQGDQARVNVKNGQEIVLDFNAGTGEIRGEGEASEIPTTMFMIGEQFGNWDWASDGVAELVPVWGTQGIFWCTRWFDHSKGFKFCSKKEWNGDFTGAGGAGYSVDGGNCWVAEDGIYTVYVNADGNIVEVAPAEVYGLGDVVFAGGGWDYDSAVKFTPEGDKMTITTTGDGELRIASKVQPTAIVDGCTPNGWFDWWKTEFIFFSDGKIIYRGLGNDQERVQVKAGQKIILDFNAGTATLESGN